MNFQTNTSSHTYLFKNLTKVFLDARASHALTDIPKPNLPDLKDLTDSTVRDFTDPPDQQQQQNRI